MATYSEHLHEIANRYMRETGNSKATFFEIGTWAIQHGLWAPQPAALIRHCAKELSRAMREEYMTDPQGRRVRAKHVAIVDCAGTLMPLCADIRTAGRAHMELAFAQRRQQIFDECKQLKADVESFNQNYNFDLRAIKIFLDFSEDLEILEDLEEREAFMAVTQP